MCQRFEIEVSPTDQLKENDFISFSLISRALTDMFLRELKVLVHQLLGTDLTEDFLALVTYLAVTQCKKVRVCDEDDDLSMDQLEALVTG